MRYIIIIVLSLLGNGLSKAQSEKDNIKQVINTMFAGMAKADSSMVHSTLDNSCTLKSVIQKKDGTTVLVEEAVREFLDIVGQPLKAKIEERILLYDIKVDGDMAMAWTPYQLFIDDKLVHCGVNVFMLARRNSEWKIIGITDTRRKDNCN